VRPTASEGLTGALLLASALLAAPAAPGAAFLSAQEMEGEMEGMEMEMEGGWVMPPMAVEMPMLPGLENAVPPDRPFLPDPGADLSDFPEAEPSRTVEMSDGDTLELSVSFVRRTLNGREYLMYGYNGQYPGPTIEAPRGSTPVVRVTNEIEMPTTVHWHGVRLDNRFDGVPGLTQEPIEPGESFTYEVKVPDAGMFWYHPHVREDVQQDLGLYGNLLVVPSEGGDYAPVNREEILALDDILMRPDGRLIPYGAEHATHALMGRFGNVMLTNGRTDYSMEVERGSVVRFYLTNVANSRTFNVRFGDRRAKLVASDVGRYERERWVPSVVIAPAERYTAEVRFDEPGTVAITNTIQAVNHFRGEFYPHVDTLALVHVSGERVATDHGERFETLAETPDVSSEIDGFRRHFDRPPDRELVATVRVRNLPLPIVQSMEADTLYVPPMEWNDAMPMMNWLSTSGQVTWILRDTETGAENQAIDWSFREGDVMKLRVFNDPDSFHPMNHPIHVHGQRFLVVSRDGVRQENLVWKDTAILPVGSTMELLVEMSNPGDWMLHCHIAEHLEAGMMFDFTVTPGTGADDPDGRSEDGSDGSGSAGKG